VLNSSYYYVCAHPDSEITLHGKNCRRLQQEGQAFLGSFYYYHQAMTVAKGRYAAIKPCQLCSGAQQSGCRQEASAKAVKPKAASARPRACAALPAKASAGTAKKRQKSGECLTPAPVPKAKGYVNRVPRKHLPENL